MGIPLYQVDAFAERPFAGNPAAVCLLSEARDDAWMQSVASEMNLAETAFLLRRDDHFSLRWFTPTVEVDLCGHATLASGHVLWESGILPKSEPARFHSISGALIATSSDGWIELDFPAEVANEVTESADYEKALGARCEWLGRNRMDYLALLESESVVRSLRPDMAGISQLGGRGVIVTARADASSSGSYDFVSRFFAPCAGIPEDPATGSSHCALGPFWSSRLGRDELTGYQASSRGGVIGTVCRGDRVILRGRARTIMKGELFV